MIERSFVLLARLRSTARRCALRCSRADTHRSRQQTCCAWRAHLSRWLEAHALGLGQLSAERVAEFLAVRRAEYSSFFTARALAPILRDLEHAGLVCLAPAAVAPSGAADRLLCSYAQYLQRERCLTPGCVDHYSAVARAFLRWRFGADQAIDIAALKAHEVTSFALYASGLYSIGTTQYAVTALRCFLRYLYLEGQVAVDFRGALPAIAGGIA